MYKSFFSIEILDKYNFLCCSIKIKKSNLILSYNNIDLVYINFQLII